MKKLFVPLVLVGLVVACDREPVAPDIGPPLFSTTRGEVVVVRTDNFTDYVSCANDGLGEIIHWSGQVRLTLSYMLTNGGNELIEWADIEYLDGYTVTGVTSGDVWTLLEFRVNNRAHFQQNGFIRNTVWLEWYENQDGDTVFVQTTAHFTVVNGEWRVARGGVTACGP